MTDDVAAKIAALKAKGDESAEKALEEREESTNWNKVAEPGDMLAGVMERGAIVPIVDDSGNPQPRHLMEIRDAETGELFTVWCSSYMLKQRIIDVAPAKDTIVVVQYHGKQVSGKTGRTFKLHTLEADQTDHEYWNDLMRSYVAKQKAKAASNGDVQASTFNGSGQPDPLEAPF